VENCRLVSIVWTNTGNQKDNTKHQGNRDSIGIGVSPTTLKEFGI